MLISPITAFENRWITHPIYKSLDEWKAKKFISPNAIDFTLDRVFLMSVDRPFVLSESKKQMRDTTEMVPFSRTQVDADVEVQNANEQLLFDFKKHETYDCLSDFYVTIPDGVCAILFTRSTLVRNGLFWISGLYDSGFAGHIGGVIHTRTSGAVIYKGTRVGQIAFMKADSAGLYAGGWNHEQGTHYTQQ